MVKSRFVSHIINSKSKPAIFLLGLTSDNFGGWWGATPSFLSYLENGGVRTPHHPHLDPSLPLSYIKKDVKDSMFLNYTSTLEVFQYISKLDNKKSSGFYCQRGVLTKSLF